MLAQFETELGKVLSDNMIRVSIGVSAEGYTGVHGGFGFGDRNEEGRTMLEFATAHDLIVANSFFKKSDAHLITFESGHKSQIDYLLVRRSDLRACKDCRAYPGEACASQHRLVIVDVLFKTQRHRKELTGRRMILWRNLKGEAVEAFRATVTEKLAAFEEDMRASNADQMWNTLACAIKDAAKDSLGVARESTRTRSTHRESWWFCEEVQTKVATKLSRFKELLSCQEGNQEDIDMAKEREGANDIYKIAKARERRRRDIGNVRFIKDEGGRTIVREDDIKKRWGEYLSSLFNETPSDEHLPEGGGEVGSTSPHTYFDYRGIKLLSHTMKLWERVIKRRVRRETRVLENQFGFMPGRSTTEAIHLLRSLMEKYREVKRKTERPTYGVS
ncbi:retrovirus-related pol polyprotein LINE-1 [Tanacetum coccineum]